jgi:hypothetical protein
MIYEGFGAEKWLRRQESFSPASKFSKLKEKYNNNKQLSAL